MKLIELESDAQLTRSLVEEIGQEYSLSERLKYKIFGLGHLRYTQGNPVLVDFHDQHHHNVKTHFDWTKKGAVIRFRTITKCYAIGIVAASVEKIDLVKNPDMIYAVPLLPFWTLLKLGVPIGVAKWFRTRADRFTPGKCELTIHLSNTIIGFELSGYLWKDCLTTFNAKKVNGKLRINDKRNWLTENGFKVNSGLRT